MTRHEGFTLVEVLVALSITSLIAALVLQLMVQGARLEIQAGRSLADGAPQSIREIWLRDALSAVLVSPADHPAAFTGDAARMEFDTPDAVVPLGPRYGRMAFELRPQSGGSTQLFAVPPLTGPAANADTSGSGLLLAHWPASAVRFRYRDAAGSWHDVWPPEQHQEPPPIPSAVSIEALGAEQLTLVVSNVNTPVRLPSRRELGYD